MKTWQVELATVAFILAGAAIVSGGSLVSWISAGAVLASFGHATVANRLQEREAARAVPHVDCHRWLTRYWYAKEAAWVAVFVLTGTWPALVGCALFLVYPSWRRWWRRKHPLTQHPEAAVGA